MWPEVVERVKEYKRVTWMLLMEQVQVTSVDDRVLVLAFGNEGKRRGFSASGHDEIVRQALIDVLGLDRRVDAVLDPSAAASAAPAAAVAKAPEPIPPEPPAEQPDDAAPNGRRPSGAAPDEERPRAAPPTVRPEDDAAADDDDDAEDTGLAGMDLVARELGGTVIGEFGPG